MSDKTVISKVLTVVQKVEIRSIAPDNLVTQTSTVPSVIVRDQPAVRRVVTEEIVIRQMNNGPPGSQGLPGAQGIQGPPGDIDNFIMDDLTTIFRGRLV